MLESDLAFRFFSQCHVGGGGGEEEEEGGGGGMGKIS